MSVQKHPQSELGMLIDGSEQNFRDFCATKSMGDLLGLKNLMSQTFEELVKDKDSILQKLVVGPTNKEIETLFNDVYSVLFRIEEKVSVLSEIIQERAKV